MHGAALFLFPVRRHAMGTGDAGTRFAFGPPLPSLAVAGTLRSSPANIPTAVSACSLPVPGPAPATAIDNHMIHRHIRRLGWQFGREGGSASPDVFPATSGGRGVGIPAVRDSLVEALTKLPGAGSVPRRPFLVVWGSDCCLAGLEPNKL
jgi:hypothetical protein